MSDGLQWLTQLERQAVAAAHKIAALERDRKTLQARLRKLEKEAGSGPTRAGWAKEREVVRDRLGRLAEHLEELL